MRARFSFQWAKRLLVVGSLWQLVFAGAIQSQFAMQACYAWPRSCARACRPRLGQGHLQRRRSYCCYQPAAINPCTPEAQIQYWSGVIARCPANRQAYLERAKAWNDLDNHGKAIEDYSAAIQLDPKNAKLYTERAELLLFEKRSNESLADLNKALEIDPGHTEAKALRAILSACFNPSGSEAIDHVSDVAKQTPGTSMWIELRGMLLMNQRKYAEAIVDFSSCISGANSSTDSSELGSAYMMRATAYQELAQYDKAIDDFSMVIKLWPDKSFGLLMRGGAFLKAGKFAKALDDCSTVIERWPDRSYGYTWKAWILATCLDDTVRDGDVAVALATRACELDKSNKWAMQVLAAAYAERGEFETAVEWQEKAIACLAVATVQKPKIQRKGVIRGSPILINKQPPVDAQQEAIARLQRYQQGEPVREGPASELQRR